jgi:hypothetical protein
VLIIEGIFVVIAVVYLRFLPKHWARHFVLLILFIATGIDALIRMALGLDLGFGHGLWYGLLTPTLEELREGANHES